MHVVISLLLLSRKFRWYLILLHNVIMTSYWRHAVFTCIHCLEVTATWPSGGRGGVLRNVSSLLIGDKIGHEISRSYGSTHKHNTYHASRPTRCSPDKLPLIKYQFVNERARRAACRLVRATATSHCSPKRRPDAAAAAEEKMMIMVMRYHDNSIV